MDPKSLASLVAIADHGSFARAAQAVGLSESRVSLQMQALERTTALTLFDRTRRPPRLTPAGQEFAARARELLAQWERLLHGAVHGVETGKGLLRVGVVHSLVTGIVTTALARLQAEQPQLAIHLLTGLSHELEERLRRAQIDCALVSAGEEVMPDVRARAVGEDPLVVVAHERARGTSDAQILTGNPYLRFAREARVARMIETALAQRDLRIVSRMEVGSLDAVLALVAAGLGVSVVPLVAGRALPEGVRAVAFGTPAQVRRLVLLEPADNPRAHLVDLWHAALLEANAQAGPPPRRLRGVRGSRRTDKRRAQ